MDTGRARRAVLINSTSRRITLESWPEMQSSHLNLDERAVSRSGRERRADMSFLKKALAQFGSYRLNPMMTGFRNRGYKNECKNHYDMRTINTFSKLYKHLMLKDKEKR